MTAMRGTLNFPRYVYQIGLDDLKENNNNNNNNCTLMKYAETF